jgi:hypothetical protein
VPEPEQRSNLSRSLGPQPGFQDLAYFVRRELGAVRIAVALLLPVAVYFYSPTLAAAVPCAFVFGWYVRRAVREFLKRAP